MRRGELALRDVRIEGGDGVQDSFRLTELKVTCGKVPNAHATVTRKALESGKLVYSEKPVTTDLAEGVANADIVIVATPVAGIAEDVCRAAAAACTAARPGCGCAGSARRSRSRALASRRSGCSVRAAGR